MQPFVAHLALIVLSFTVVVFGLAGMRDSGLNHWYLFFVPLLLSAHFYALRGALLTGLATFGALLQIYTHRLEGLRDLVDLLPRLAARGPGDDYTWALTGTLLMVLGALLLGYVNGIKRLHTAHIATLSTRDPLTGLLNRQHFGAKGAVSN